MLCIALQLHYEPPRSIGNTRSRSIRLPLFPRLAQKWGMDVTSTTTGVELGDCLVVHAVGLATGWGTLNETGTTERRYIMSLDNDNTLIIGRKWVNRLLPQINWSLGYFRVTPPNGAISIICPRHFVNPKPNRVTFKKNILVKKMP